MKNNQTDKIIIEPIEIRQTGSYFGIDEHGYIINPSKIENIQESWKPIVLDIVEGYKKLFGEKLKQVYVRGSVAKGEAIEGISDVDAYAYIDMTKDELEANTEIKEIISSIEGKYSFAEGIEMGTHPLSEIEDDNILLNQSLCVSGEPINVPKMKPGKDMAIHSPSFYKKISWFEKFLDKEESDEEVKSWCIWLMKGLLRVGFEITMERSKKYTRDLYRCYETFVQFYPEKETEMREVLYLALNPTPDKNKLEEIMDDFGQWLLSEVPKHFEIKK